MFAFVFALFFYLPLLQSQAQTLAPHVVIDQVSDYYGRLNSLSADFEQIQKVPNRTWSDRGHVYLKTGRRARFDYESPARSDYFNGKTYTKYVTGQDQAVQQAMGRSEDERLLIFLVLGNRESPWKDEFERFEELRETPRFPGNKVIRMLPHNTKSIQSVLVEVNPATSLIHRFGFTKADKSYTEYVFTNIKTTPLENSLFEFKPPPGVRVFVK